MKNLNFGCGDRFCLNDWTNLDFHSHHRSVIQHNLLERFPFQDSTFDSVYSSHVLEHFPLYEGNFLLCESFRVLRPGGIIRVVVPDLESTCREYVRILDAYETDDLARRQHAWILIELLDQMVRNRPSGMVPDFKNQIVEQRDHEIITYVQNRTQNTPWAQPTQKAFLDRLKSLYPAKVKEKLLYFWVRLVRMLLPKALRKFAIDDTPLGEKHRWMYDRYSLRSALEAVGFDSLSFKSHSTSDIAGFLDAQLDSHADGSPYKNNSIYVEAVKPAH